MRTYTYESLRRRVEKLERMILNEGKQVGTLYHICDVKQFIKYVLPKDQLKASGKYYNGLYKSNDYISLTRNKYYTLVHDLSDYSGVFIRLVIDGDRLSDNYRIGPYNDVQFDIETGEFLDLPSDGDDAPRYREQEEVVKGPINNLSRYLKEIQIDVADLSDNTMNVLKRSATKLKTTRVVYNNFMKRDQSTTVRKCIRECGVKDGDDLTTIIDALKKAAKANPEPDLFSKDFNKVKRAIDAGADVNAKYDRGYLLGFYCFWGKLDIIKLLIDAGADANNLEDPPIIHAEGDNTDVYEILIDNGADVNVVDKSGSTPLFSAAYKGNADAVELLINSGADVNAVNNHGMTPLKMSGSSAVSDLLIEAGAKQ